MVVKFVIEGSTPAKKNSRQLFYKNGRMINIPSKKYQEWHKSALGQLKTQKIQPLNPPYDIFVQFWMKDNRRCDIDNKLASICDLLQDAGIIEDDSWQVLKSITAQAGGIDKNRPRAEICITAD